VWSYFSQFSFHRFSHIESFDEVGNAPSTLNLILPEVYLGTDKEESLLSSISESLTKYRSDGTLVKNEEETAALVEKLKK